MGWVKWPYQIAREEWKEALTINRWDEAKNEERRKKEVHSLESPRALFRALTVYISINRDLHSNAIPLQI